MAVSGGADSLALLHVLVSVQAELEIELVAATFDHGLRGADSAADVQHVIAFAEALGVAVYSGAAGATLRNLQTGNLEAAARQVRYDFLATIAQQVTARHIVTAHHADDQAETILMHLLRGSGLNGLTGMQRKSPVPGHPDLTLVRPLLDVTRAEIEAYLLKHGIAARYDPTNDDTSLLRNAIRHSVMPLLKQHNPAAAQTIARVADAVAADVRYLDAEAKSAANEIAAYEARRVWIRRDGFVALPAALQRRTLMHIAHDLHGDYMPQLATVTAAVETALHGQTGAIAQLGQGIRLRVQYDRFAVEFEGDPLPVANYPQLENDFKLTGTGSYAIDDHFTLHLSVSAADHPAQQIALPAAQLHVRRRQPGDRIKPAGMNGHSRKLKDWLIDRKIPAHVRDKLPLLCAGDDIAAILLGTDIIVMYGYQENEFHHTLYYLWLTS